MYIFYNGDIINDSAINIEFDDRAFMYGDGLFETLIFEQGQIKFELYHKERLQSGMEAMNLVCPTGITIDSIFKNIDQLVNKSGHQSTRVRLQVWRSSGGLYTPLNNECNILATCAPYEIGQELIKRKVSFSKTVRLIESKWSAYKTISAMPYVQAGIEKTQRKLDDLILLDHQDHISECTSSNIFWKKGSTYYTPSLATGCIDGVMRKHIINTLEKNQTSIEIGEYHIDVLERATEVFTSNVTGTSPLLCIDDIQYSEKVSITPLLAL